MPFTIPPVVLQVATRLLVSEAFWKDLLHGSAVAVEEASPNYTQAHKVAAFMQHLLGAPEISTPDAASAKSVAKAILDGVQPLAADVAAAAAGAELPK